MIRFRDFWSDWLLFRMSLALFHANAARPDLASSLSALAAKASHAVAGPLFSSLYNMVNAQNALHAPHVYTLPAPPVIHITSSDGAGTSEFHTFFSIVVPSLLSAFACGACIGLGSSFSRKGHKSVASDSESDDESSESNTLDVSSLATST